MGAINNAFNKAGLSILSLASATAKYRARRNEEGKNRAKLNYSTAATIKKQNNELTKKQSEPPKSYLDINSPLPPEKAKKQVQRFGEIPTVSSEMDEQKIAEQKVLEQIAQEKTKAASFVKSAGVEEAPAPNISSEEGAYLPIKAENSETELPTVSAEHSETNIDAKDPEVQGLIELKQKNALRAVAGQRSQKRYQNIKAKLTGIFADYSNIDDVWREISLAPDITDEMIKKAGFTKTQILEEWQWFKNSPSDWMAKQNARGDEYGAGGGNVADTDDFSNYDFGGMLSTYIRAKAGGKTLAQQQEEYELSKAEKDDELYESIGEAMEEHELKQAKNKQPSVDDWYINFDRNNNRTSNSDNYKVWQDDSTEDEKDEEKKDKGIIF